MNRSSHEKRVQIAHCLIAGYSVRETCRITGVAKNTVTKLRRDLGLPAYRRRGKGHALDPIPDPVGALIDGAVSLLERHETAP